MTKRYIGDSVYADYESQMVKLTTDNGLGASNTIYMEPEVVMELLRYLERIYNVKITVEKIKPEPAPEETI